MTKCLMGCLLALLACAPFAVAGEPAADERVVVVTGIGVNADEANRQAYRMAVQSVVGAMVMAETQIQNDELIRDKVVSHSDGYVTKVRQIGAARPAGNGLVEVTVAATVATGRVREKLKAENIAITQMDGTSLFAELATKAERSDSLSEGIAELLRGMPVNALKATAGKPALNDKKAVVVPVVVEVNQAAYQKFCRDFTDGMRKLGVKTVSRTASIKSSSKTADYVEPYPLLWKDSPGTVTIALCERIDLPTLQTRWKVFHIDEKAFEGFMTALKWHSVRVEILDGGGQVLAEQSFRLYARNRNKKSDKPGAITSYYSDDMFPILAMRRIEGRELLLTGGIVPRLDFVCAMSPASGDFKLGTKTGDRLEKEVQFILSADELKQAANVRCTVYADE